MRTTIELSDDHRARLLALSERRGLRGYSALIAEALDGYLAEADLEPARIRRAPAVCGTLPDEEAGELRRYARRLRRAWR